MLNTSSHTEGFFLSWTNLHSSYIQHWRRLLIENLETLLIQYNSKLVLRTRDMYGVGSSKTLIFLKWISYMLCLICVFIFQVCCTSSYESTVNHCRLNRLVKKIRTLSYWPYEWRHLDEPPHWYKLSILIIVTYISVKKKLSISFMFLSIFIYFIYYCAEKKYFEICYKN